MIKKKFIPKLNILLGIACIIYFLGLITFTVTVAFSMFWLLIGVIFIGIGILGLNKSNENDKILKIIHSVITVCLVIFILIEIPIIYFGSKTYHDSCDYVIILGAGLNGKELSLALYQRMVTSIEYIHDNPQSKIIVSGGKGPGESISEAKAMKDFLVKHGIDESRIIMEDKSKSTYQNLYNTKKILEFAQNRDINDLNLCVVSSNFHIARVKMLGKRLGMNINGIPSPVHVFLIPNFYVRESLAMVKSYIFDK